MSWLFFWASFWGFFSEIWRVFRTDFFFKMLKKMHLHALGAILFQTPGGERFVTFRIDHLYSFRTSQCLVTFCQCPSQWIFDFSDDNAMHESHGDRPEGSRVLRVAVVVSFHPDLALSDLSFSTTTTVVIISPNRVSRQSCKLSI